MEGLLGMNAIRYFLLALLMFSCASTASNPTPPNIAKAIKIDTDNYSVELPSSWRVSRNVANSNPASPEKYDLMAVSHGPVGKYELWFEVVVFENLQRPKMFAVSVIGLLHSISTYHVIDAQLDMIERHVVSTAWFTVNDGTSAIQMSYANGNVGYMVRCFEMAQITDNNKTDGKVVFNEDIRKPCTDILASFKIKGPVRYIDR